MKDRSDDQSHHERTLLPWSYISLWLEQEIAQWVHHEGSIRRPIAPWANAPTMELHLALTGTRNSSMGPPWRIDPTTNRTMSERCYDGATSRCSLQWVRVRVRACCGVATTHLGPGHVVVPAVERAAQLHGQSLLVVLWLVFRHSKQHRRSVGGCRRQHKHHSTHSVRKTICDDAQENQSDVAISETSIKAH